MCKYNGIQLHRWPSCLGFWWQTSHVLELGIQNQIVCLSFWPLRNHLPDKIHAIHWWLQNCNFCWWWWGKKYVQVCIKYSFIALWLNIFSIIRTRKENEKLVSFVVIKIYLVKSYCYKFTKCCQILSGQFIVFAILNSLLESPPLETNLSFAGKAWSSPWGWWSYHYNVGEARGFCIQACCGARKSPHIV